MLHLATHPVLNISDHLNLLVLFQRIWESQKCLCHYPQQSFPRLPFWLPRKFLLPTNPQSQYYQEIHCSASSLTYLAYRKMSLSTQLTLAVPFSPFVTFLHSPSQLP